jgi:hypothetical protein
MTISGSDQSVTIAGTLTANGSSITPSQWTSNSTAIYYNTGNVGIGTASPANKLDVNGALRSIASSTASSGAGVEVDYGGAGTGIGRVLAYDRTTASFKQLNLQGQPITFVNGSSEAMRIDTSGNLLVGTTSTAAANGTNLEVANATIARLILNQTGTRRFSLGSGSNAFNIYDETADAERFKITSAGLLQFNSGYGSAATAYGCRAWVNFNGTGTVDYRGGGNVSSITDNGTGDYTVNFVNAMPDTNYAPAYGCGTTNTGGSWDYPAGTYQTLTTSLRMRTFNTDNTALVDTEMATAAVFR